MNIIGYSNYQIHLNGTIIGARGTVLKPDENSTGYKRVTLCKEGKTKRRFVHQLVAEHFSPNPYQRKYVNHIDGDIHNNHARNLEWCTASYNVKHGFERGRKVPWAVSDRRRKVILILHETGFSTKEIAEELHLHTSTIQRILKPWREGATTISKESTLK